MEKKLNIIHLSSEISPYSKTGGLADVTRSLPRSLKRLGHNVAVITPYYGFIRRKKWKVINLEQKISVSFAGIIYKFGIKKIICPDKYPVFFICQNKLFESVGSRNVYNYSDKALKYLLFSLASIELIKVLKLNPNIIHCHDWHTGLVPNYLKLKYNKDLLFKNIPVIFTIHNLLYQGPEDWWNTPLNKLDNGQGIPAEDEEEIKHLNFVKRGVIYSDIINTVSMRYAKEILTPEFGCKLEKDLQAREKDLYGIINGVDYNIFNPKFDKNIYVNYGANSLQNKTSNKLYLQKKYKLKVDPSIPLIGMANRLTEQKGFRLIVKILDYLLKSDIQVAIIGSGGSRYKGIFKKQAAKYPKKLLFITPFKEDVGRKVYAASDIYLMPSRFEPCGISQLISLRYGSIPIVHEVGGLMDTIVDYNPETGKGNGFVFNSYTSRDLLFAIARAVENYKHKKEWKKLVRVAMKESYSWKIPAQKYIGLYRRAIKQRHELG